jgi:hypothetical protein
MGHTIIRGLIAAFGALSIIGGLAGLAVGGPSAAAGLWGVVVGLVLIAAVAFERSRYRSEAADDAGARAGPGGGEPIGEALEPRFQPTAEVFEDPTTHRRMRVFVDPRTGERRYVAEG